MSYLAVGVSLALIAWVLADAFEAMLLPRRITHRYRFARLFYVYSWTPWAALARRSVRASGGTRSSVCLALFLWWCSSAPGRSS